MERILKLNDVGMSVDRVPDIAKTITIRMPIRDGTIHRTMFPTKSHESITFLFDDDF